MKQTTTPAKHMARTVALRLTRHRRPVAALLAALSVAFGLAAVRPPGRPEVRVLAAARDLPGGAELRRQDVRPVAIPPGAVPDGALRHHVVGRTLAGPMRRGEIVTDARLISGGLLRGYGPDVVATPVRMADAAATRLLRPGDRIDVFASDPSTGLDVTDLVPGDAHSHTPDADGTSPRTPTGHSTTGPPSGAPHPHGSPTAGAPAMTPASFIASRPAPARRDRGEFSAVPVPSRSGEHRHSRHSFQQPSVHLPGRFRPSSQTHHRRGFGPRLDVSRHGARFSGAHLQVVPGEGRRAPADAGGSSPVPAGFPGARLVAAAVPVLAVLRDDTHAGEEAGVLVLATTREQAAALAEVSGARLSLTIVAT